MRQPRRISPLAEIRSVQADNSQSHSNTPHSTILRNTTHRCPSSIAGSQNVLDLAVGYRRDRRSANSTTTKLNNQMGAGRRQLLDNPHATTWYRRRIKRCRIYHSFNYLLYPLSDHQNVQHLCQTLAIFYPAAEKWKWLNNNRKKWKRLNNSLQLGGLMAIKIRVSSGPFIIPERSVAVHDRNGQDAFIFVS